MVNKWISYVKVIYLVKKIDKQLKNNGFKIIYEKYLDNQKLNPLRNLIQDEIEFIERYLTAIDKVCFYFIGNARCLHRSVVGYHIFREKKIPIDLVIGVSKKPFMSHAWLEYNGQVINDDEEYIKPLTIQFHTKKFRKIG
jgi:hypothetical protein